MNYLFPYELVKEKSKVVIWGSGEVGYDFYQQIMTSGYCALLGWTDSQYTWYQYLGLPVTAPDGVDWDRVDAVVVAVTKQEHYQEIKQTVRQRGIPENHIFWKQDYALRELPVPHLDKERRGQEAKRARRCVPKDFVTEKRLDIVIRYMYAKELLQGIGDGEGCRLYTKFIEKKGLEEPISNKVFAFFSDYEQKIGVSAYKESFQELIRSMKTKDFEKEYFVPLDKHGEIINGAHRLAAALALEIPAWAVDFPLFEGFGFDFSQEWMERNGFSHEEIQTVKERLEQLKTGCHEEEVLPVIFSASNEYVPYLAVALLSLIENISADRECRIYVLHREMKEHYIFRLESMSTDHILIQCVDVSEHLEDKHFYGGSVEVTKHISEETFYRLLIPEVLPQYKKILYLDCDLIILGDVAKLYETDLQGNVFGAVYSVEHWNQMRTGTIPDEKEQEWFNAGVLLMDMEQFQKEGCLEQCRRLMGRQIFDVLDQDLLRIVGYGKTYYLPYQWNVMWHHLQSDINGLKEHNRDVYLEAVRHPEIVHYTSGIKPWNRPKGPLAEHFWRYARRSDFYEEILYQNLNGGTQEEENIFGTYLFPFDCVPRGADIILYGAGNVGKTFKKQVEATGWCNIMAWADKNYSSKEGRKRKLINPVQIREISCEGILIAVEKETVARQIMKDIVDIVGKEVRLFWENPRREAK